MGGGTMTEQIDGIQLENAFTNVTEHIQKTGDDALKRDWILVMKAYRNLAVMWKERGEEMANLLESIETRRPRG